VSAYKEIYQQSPRMPAGGTPPASRVSRKAAFSVSPDRFREIEVHRDARLTQECFYE